MRAEYRLRGFLQQLVVESMINSPRKPFTDWVSQRIAKQLVTIRPRGCVEARMKIIAGDLRIPHRNVAGQFRVQRADEFVVGVSPVEFARRNLSRRMNAGVGPPREERRTIRPSESAQSLFQFALHRPLFRLPLASEEVRAVVGKSQLVTCHLTIYVRSAVELLNERE